jgi:HlyD family secretion protein
VKLTSQKAIILVGLLLLLIGGGAFFVIRVLQTNEPALPAGITTVPVSRGEIITRVGSTGKVRPNQIIDLKWQTAGHLGKINIKDMDNVKAGDVLLELEPSSLPSSILKAMEDLPAAQRALDLLQVSDVKRTQAKEDLAKAQIELKNTKDVLALKNQRNTSDSNLEAAQATYLQAKANLESVETFFSFLQDRPEDDSTRAQVTAQLSLARKNYNWALWNYQWAQNKPLPEDVQIASANFKVAESKLADAQRDWEKVKNNPDPDDLLSAKTTVEALNSQIDLSKIVAPISGTIVDFKQLPGDVVQPGMTALTLVDASRLFLDISITEVDINRIQIGKDVTVTFDALPDKTFQGIVSEISKVGISDQEIIYYTVTCEINDFDKSIKTGMTAAASIQENKVENVIVVPNEAIFLTGTQRSVFVVRDNSIKQIPVELGLVSDVKSEIKSGDVHEGDAVVTNPKIIPIPKSGK